jgi:hypothetical protein
MNMVVQKETLLEKAENALKNVKVSILTAAKYLHEVKATNAFEGRYSSFGEFVESNGMSQSFAAKLTKVWEYWVEQAKVSPTELKEIPAENLYLAINLPGNDEDKLAHARTLTRSEIKAELAEKDGHECEHLTKITICASCHARI